MYDVLLTYLRFKVRYGLKIDLSFIENLKKKSMLSKLKVDLRVKSREPKLYFVPMVCVREIST